MGFVVPKLGAPQRIMSKPKVSMQFETHEVKKMGT
jgi:hypothetical protein